MPRSVNSVASKARRDKILKAAKGYFGRRKNVHTIAKNAEAKAIVTFSVSGETTMRMSRERAPVLILGLSPNIKTARKMQIMLPLLFEKSGFDYTYKK